ncbi:MAG: 16S rRNA (adenine(1518)-N(6)/adenine(1519)-N(6))-dimethyltransferase RsmA [Lachnospiraceae bacterium]|nr:16S rRNA (adenine(1518)-N(6)/adenine(1519)-N(6))-dimethyltransferase RsmA [Lachnospiraceae bacterium]
MRIGTAGNTADILSRHKFSIRKKYGQNFLVDASMLEKIVETAGIGGDDAVLEIGPGLGAMTQLLAERAGSVTAVEIDKELIPILKETLADYSNVNIISGDIMKQDLKELCGGGRYKVVANLPYYITTPIVMKLLEENASIESITIMIQKEVAQRMQTGPGSKDYGALSLAVQYYAKPVYVCTVPPECFIPRPGVDSAVVRLEVFDTPPVKVKDPEFMFKLIRAAFNQRRKTLGNAVSGDAALNISRESVQQALTGLGMDEMIRGERLTLEEFARLADVLEDSGNK